MSAITRKHITDCNCLEKCWGGVKLSAYSLLLSLFFTSASFAQDTTKKIDQEFLNSLTPDKVTWTTATDEEIIAGKDIALIDGVYYKYSYTQNQPPEINTKYLNNLTPDKVTWTTATDKEIIAGKNIALIDGVYYKYSYNNPSYNKTNKRLNDELTTSNTQSVVFNNIASTVDGGAIANTQNFNNPINADFIGNYIQTQSSNGYGGAIFNYGQNSSATIGDITGDFIGNYINTIFNGGGGAIFNVEKASIGNINGNFIGNYTQAQAEGRGGAISNYGLSGPLATINDITGDFIGNYMQTATGKGGAIYNSGTINNITGNFVVNYVQAQTEGRGGAIYNYGESDFLSSIGDIKGDFIGNYIQTATGSGGAIYNLATIGDITGDFIGNYIQAQTEGRGGAIYNSGSYYTTIGNITGDFIGNYIQTQSSNGYGGAIFNNATIGDITGDFIGNYIQAQSSGFGGAISNLSGSLGNITGYFIGNYIQAQTEGLGGAIFNIADSIGDITGDFIGNYIQTQSSGEGGAIYNNFFGTIGNITGDFIGNYIQTQSYGNGGAIYNGIGSYYTTIGDITGDFIGNYIQAQDFGKGGAIFNAGEYVTIGDITGDFIGNYIQAQYSGEGGAIFNAGTYDTTIGNITGDFIGNYVQAQKFGSGGAIYNEGSYATIGDITGDFIGNYIQAQSSYGYGGAIYNPGTLGNITGDFIGNYIQTQSSGSGGAIYNYGESDFLSSIGDITGDFIGNYVQAQKSGDGGAIYNHVDASGSTVSIGDITGDFIGNYIQAQTLGRGGAIYNHAYYSGSTATIGDITGDFIGNYIQTQSSGSGGAIYNYGNNYSSGTIGDITGDFIGNYIQAQSYGYGGAIYNRGTIGDITGDFIGNYIQAQKSGNGGAIYNYDSTATIGDITGDFIGNYIQAQYSGYGGAIYNSGSKTTIGDITGDFIGNYIQTQSYGYGGAISNQSDYSGSTATIGDITGDFIGNYIQAQKSGYGGAIYNRSDASGATVSIGDITGDFIGNYIQTQSSGSGGAIYNSGTLSLINADFYDNYVQTNSPDKTYAQGGAIYNGGTLNITANDGKQSVFDGNHIIYKDSSGNDIKESNALHMAGGTTNLSAIEGGQIIFNDKITASKGSAKLINQNQFIVYNDLNNKALFNYEGFFNSSEYYNNDIEDYLNNYVDNSRNASWEFIDGKYILTETDIYISDYNKYITEFTHIDELDGYVETYISEYGYFMQPDEYDGDLASYVKNFVEEIQSWAYASYYEKDGVYYITETDVYGYVRYYTYTEDTDAGGVWYSEKRNDDNKRFEVFSLEDYNGNIEKYLTENGYTFVKKDELYYVLDSDEFIKINPKMEGYISQGQYISKENAEKIFTEAKANGKFVVSGGNNIIISDKEIYAGESGLFYQDDNGDIVFVNLLENDIKFNLTGDGTGKIVFNNDIKYDGNISIDNVEVEVNGKGLDRATLQNGSVVNVGIGGRVKDSIINQSSLLNIKNGGHALSTMVANGGKLVVQSGGLAENSVVFAGGTLEAQTQARLHNLLAKSDSYLNISADTLLTGNIIIDRHANLGGSYDYKKIFKDNITNGASLILEGGINNNLNKDSLINTAQNKKLVLSSGTFDIGSGANNVSGWKELSAKNNATIKLVADTNNKSQIASEIINMSSGSTLDLAGNSPLIGTINASVNNDGLINFSHNSDGADDIVTIKGTYHAYKNASMIIDVDPSNNTADLLIIEGDVVGRTKVVIRPTGSGLLTAKALFVSAPNDDVSTGAYFDVFRMDGDAREWYSLYENNKWYVTNDNTSSSGYGTTDDDKELVLGDDVYDYEDIINITSGKPKVVAEALAYMALPQIGLEQTRDLVRVIANKVASTKHISGQCGMGECEYDGASLNGAWINLGQTQSNIDTPIVVEAKIKAVDLGFDIQHNLNNRLGIFGSYRQGNYELSGEGKDYYSSTGSEYDIDSWILGLYHRYDKDKLWALSTVYGGIQQVDMTTDDNVSSDTTGIQFGASIEAGMVFEPQKRLTVEPSIRLGYNFIKYDNMSDEYGKTAKFDNIHNIETEAGIKIEKTFFHDNKKHSISKIYLKPSIIRNFGKGNVSVTSLDSVEGVENQTLIRGEIGGSINIGNGWSGFGSAGYTFGSNYNASDFNLGINYNW